MSNPSDIDYGSNISIKQTLRRHQLQLFALITSAIFFPLFIACLIIGHFIIKPQLGVLADAGLLTSAHQTAWIIACSFLVAFLAALFIFILLSYERISTSFKILMRMINENFLMHAQPTKISESLLTTYADDTAGHIAKLLLTLKSNIANYRNSLIGQARESEKLHRELVVAGDIQNKMLVHNFDDLIKQYSNIDIFADLIPAKEIGGDLYDCFIIDDDHLLIAIGDVCGKGVPASLIMLRTITILRAITTTYKSLIGQELSPANILTVLNEMLCEDNPLRMFVTMVVGIIDKQSGEFHFCNAGHNPPAYLNQTNGELWLTQKPQKPLGLRRTAAYSDQVITLQADDMILLYTDGIVEAMNAQQQLFSEQRLAKCLEQNAALPAESLVNTIMQDVINYAHGTKQSDDMTVLALRWKPKRIHDAKQPKVKPAGKARTITQEKYNLVSTNNLSEIPRIQQELQKFFLDNDFTETICTELALCIEEIVANIITHGYGVDVPGTIDITARIKPHVVTLTFIDQAAEFNPNELISRDLAQSRRKRGAQGGRGIYLVSNLTDNMEYLRKGDKNIFTITKQILIG